MPAEDAISVVQTGTAISFNATATRVPIPNESAGGSPKYIRVAATQPCCVKIGDSGVTATSGDVLVQPADAVIMKVLRQTYISVIQLGGTAGVCVVSPMEGQ